MRSEYRNKIDGKYSKKIEAIVRKAPKEIKTLEDELNSTSPCPICDTDIPTMEITCYQCKSTLPICIATVSDFRASVVYYLSLLFSLRSDT